jgi:truncated hemoglobin YjbI
MTETIYEAAGGRQAFINLARAWHARCLADPVVSHAFSHGYHPQHTERLAAYWAEALGGPTDYTESMGDESRVVRMHSGNGEHVEMAGFDSRPRRLGPREILSALGAASSQSRSVDQARRGVLR